MAIPNIFPPSSQAEGATGNLSTRILPRSNSRGCIGARLCHDVGLVIEIEHREESLAGSDLEVIVVGLSVLDVSGAESPAYNSYVLSVRTFRR
jgi:hypothetical protein